MPLVDLKVDPQTGDLVVENGDWVVVEGLDAMVQQITIALRTFRGEWFRNNQVGIPYFEANDPDAKAIFDKQTSQEDIEAILKTAILGVPGVLGLSAFEIGDFNAGERILRVTFSATTSEGAIEDLNVPVEV